MRLAIGIVAGVILVIACIWSWRLSNVDNTEQDDAKKEGGR